MREREMEKKGGGGVGTNNKREGLKEKEKYNGHTFVEETHRKEI